MPLAKVTSPDAPALRELCAKLADAGAGLDQTGRWPAEQLSWCGEAGVYRWFMDDRWGGEDWSDEQTVLGYLALASACLTTTFILTQRTGACRRIAGCTNEALKERLLPGLASGELFATVGISHLTTSRRHLGRPVLTAEETATGFRLEGLSPWVTGGGAADVIVIAATVVENGAATDRELLVAVPKDSPGLAAAEPLSLVGLSASSTGPVYLTGVEISPEWVIAGPAPNIMQSGLGGNAGGYETSALAIGLARAAIEFLVGESARRSEIRAPLDALASEHRQLQDDLLALVRGEAACSKESLRQRANTFVLRATQAALSAAKGTGYVVGHPAGRWCREALFFLVWSCPQPVAAANLCELAGILD
ncbi:MAG TPA: acyl-CoA dehydrogenase family protein [Lacipirellulaceae bacterium]